MELSWKKVYSRATTKSILLLQPEHGFCQQNWPERGLGIRMKKWWWIPFAWMEDVVLQGAWVLHCISKGESDESLPLLAFWRHAVNVIFVKYSKEVRLFLSHLRILNIPSDVCYDDTKHYQVQSEHRHIQSPFKYLRWSVFAQRANSLKSLNGYAKTLHLRYLKEFWISICWKTRQV